jgi:HEAT repeat protein
MLPPMAMTAHLKKIVALLEKGTVEESIAAAVVLGALAPKEPAVVKALGKALSQGENLPLALASARALGAVGNAAALKELLPLLHAKGELRDTGALAIAGCGKAALPAVKKALAGADFHEKRILYEILARMHTAESLRLVLDAFFEPNFEMVKTVGRALRADVGNLSPAERKAAAKTVLTFLKSKAASESRSAVNSAIIYLGHLAQAEAIPELLKHTAPELPRATRRHALQAVRHTLQGKSAPAKVVQTIFPYLDDPNFEDVVDPTLLILERTSLPAGYEKDLERLVGGRFPQVRQFAVRKIAESRGKRGAEILVGLLEGGDDQLRRSAVFALKNSERAPGLLLPKLLAEKDPDKAWELVHLVKPHASALTPAERKKVADTAMKHLDKGDRRMEPLLHLFRNADPGGYYKAFYARAMKARTARRYADAERDLRLISRESAFDTEARFQLGLMMLLGAGKSAGPQSPKVRQAVKTMAGLADDPKFSLPARLKKEARALGAEGQYLIGFNLVEQPGALKVLGAKLLEGLVKKGARTKIGKMARAKLETEGLA